MKKNLITILLIVFSVFTYSQNQVNTKNEKIKSLMTLTGSGNLGVSMIDTMIESFKKTMPEVPNEFWIEFRKEVNAEEIVNLMIPIYDKYFTEKEVDELIAFYNTPIGKKMISTLPTIMKESMEVGKIWGQELGKKVYNRLKDQHLIEE